MRNLAGEAVQLGITTIPCGSGLAREGGVSVTEWGLTHRFREQARSHTSPFPQALGHELLRVMASYLAVVQFA